MVTHVKTQIIERAIIGISVLPKRSYVMFLDPSPSKGMQP
jgi:hypothetical protein